MNWLIDTQLPHQLTTALKKRGHSAVHASELPAGHTTTDAGSPTQGGITGGETVRQYEARPARVHSVYLGPMRMSILALLVLLTFQAAAQTPAKPLFAGAEDLDTCLVDLPLSYAKRDKERYTKAAHAFRDVELIRLVYDKKSKMADYTRVYVGSMIGNDGKEYVFLEWASDHIPSDGATRMQFLDYNAYTHRFYIAGCFDAQLRAHPELKNVLREGKP